MKHLGRPKGSKNKIPRERICKKCGDDLVVSENWSNNNKKHFNYICKPCRKEYVTNYRSGPGRKEQEKINDKNSYERRKHTILAVKDKSKRKIKPGIYGIFSDCKLIYIGESKQPLSRSYNHFSICKPGSQNNSLVSAALSNGELQRDKLRFKMLEFIDDAKARQTKETALIQRYTPIYNRDHMY